MSSFCDIGKNIASVCLLSSIDVWHYRETTDQTIKKRWGLMSIVVATAVIIKLYIGDKTTTKM